MDYPADLPLFTPGPLTTSRTVKQAMLRDMGSRDRGFLDVIARVRAGMLAIGGVTAADGWACVPMQGSGTFAIESVISTAVPKDGRLVVAANGAYGRRMATIGERHGIETQVISFDEESRIDPAKIDAALAAGGGGSAREGGRSTLLACVHCETTTGLVNPIAAVARAAKARGAALLVDSMSGYGALPLDLAGADGEGITWVATSSNKCVEGAPGLGIVLARTAALEACEGRARTLSLDVHDQWRGLERDGQFRFTPPTHVLLALEQALRELAEEGGPAARLARYARVQRIVVDGLRGLGYRTLLPDDLLSPIITSFRYPEEGAAGAGLGGAGGAFDFDRFAEGLREMGYVIYPGKVSTAACFRVGSIGRLRESDAHGLVRAVAALGVSAIRR